MQDIALKDIDIKMKSHTRYDVIVYVMAYNHEKYIKQCLDSIFSQKCTFDFAVAVCDDCSTDNTRGIVDSFKKMYGERLIQIYQKSDMMKEGKYNFHMINIQHLPVTKYVALAEGDDYWTDENKLEKQYWIMEKNRKCSCCFHATDLLDEITGTITYHIPDARFLKRKSGLLDNKKSIISHINRGNWFSYNSYFIRQSVISTIDFNNSFWNCWAGDYAWFLYLATIGKVYCINECMSVKRVNNEGSYSLDAQNNTEKEGKRQVVWLNQEIEQLQYFNKLSRSKYSIYINNQIILKQIKLFYVKQNLLEKSKHISHFNGRISEGKRLISKVENKVDNMFGECYLVAYLRNCALRKTYANLENDK